MRFYVLRLRINASKIRVFRLNCRGCAEIIFTPGNCHPIVLE
jgi:hypothetical protein